MAPDLGSYLQQRLAERGWTYSDLAKRMGLHVSLVSRVIRGRRRASMGFVQRCAQALALPPADLLLAAGWYDPARAADGSPELRGLVPYVQWAGTAEGKEDLVRELPRKLDRVQCLPDPTARVAVLVQMIRALAERWRRTTGPQRVLIGGVLLYFISPVDLVPDFIPGTGLLDDLNVAALVMRLLTGDAPPASGSA